MNSSVLCKYKKKNHSNVYFSWSSFILPWNVSYCLDFAFATVDTRWQHLVKAHIGALKVQGAQEAYLDLQSVAASGKRSSELGLARVEPV